MKLTGLYYDEAGGEYLTGCIVASIDIRDAYKAGKELAERLMKKEGMRKLSVERK